MKKDMQENSASQEVLIDHVRKMSKQLDAMAVQVSRVHAVLKSLSQKGNKHDKDTEEKILINVKEIVLPCLEELKRSQLNVQQAACVELAEKYLREILSPFVNNITSKYLKLSPREIQVANMVKEGKTSKEIASLMNISAEAVDIHRNRIRKKLGLTNRRVNLRSYLMSFLNG
jgi:DNA-binding CsgD family transcriptional regulator